jgi:hypothetical protein
MNYNYNADVKTGERADKQAVEAVKSGQPIPANGRYADFTTSCIATVYENDFSR